MTRRVTAALALGLSLTLTACGGSDDTGGRSTPTETGPVPWETDGSSSSSTDGSTDTSETTDGSGDDSSSTSTRTFPSPTDTGDPFDREEFVDQIKQAVKETPTAEVTITVSDNGTTVSSAKGVQDLDKDLVDMELDLGGVDYTYRHVDGRYYLAQPPKWVELKKGTDDAMIQQFALLHAKRQLTAFTEGVTTVGDKGPEDVDGTPTTHYTAQIDIKKAYEAMREEPPADLGDTVIYDVWLDEDNLIRKMSLNTGTGEAVLTMDRWGEPADITAPKKSDLIATP